MTITTVNDTVMYTARSGETREAAGVTIIGNTGANPFSVGGNVASAAADSGAPVKVGGVVETAQYGSALVNGTRNNMLLSQYGWLKVNGAQQAAHLDGSALGANVSYMATGDLASKLLATVNYVYNGTNQYLQRGDNTGTFVVGKGNATLATNQVSVLTTATLIAAARTGRNTITITNVTGAQQVFIGNTGVTAANGHLLPAAVGATLTLTFSGAVYGIAITGAQTVSFAELY